MAGQMEIMMKAERKAEVLEVMRLLGEMNTEEQKEMLVFMQGMRFEKEKGSLTSRTADRLS